MDLKTTVAFYLPEHRQKRSYGKIICKLIIAKISKRLAIEVFRFVGDEQVITNCLQKDFKKPTR